MRPALRTGARVLGRRQGARREVHQHQPGARREVHQHQPGARREVRQPGARNPARLAGTQGAARQPGAQGAAHPAGVLNPAGSAGARAWKRSAQTEALATPHRETRKSAALRRRADLPASGPHDPLDAGLSPGLACPRGPTRRLARTPVPHPGSEPPPRETEGRVENPEPVCCDRRGHNRRSSSHHTYAVVRAVIAARAYRDNDTVTALVRLASRPLRRGIG